MRKNKDHVSLFTSGNAPSALLFASAQYYRSLSSSVWFCRSHFLPGLSRFCTVFVEAGTTFNDKETESDTTRFLLNAQQMTD